MKEGDADVQKRIKRIPVPPGQHEREPDAVHHNGRTMVIISLCVQIIK